MKFLSFNENNRINCFTFLLSSITKLLIILSIFKLINQIESNKQKEKKISKESLKYLSNNFPDELEDLKKVITKKESKDCFNEILLIYRKDFLTNGGKNPYNSKNNQISEKYFQKASNKIWKKLNKISFLESKNFTGIRWIDFRSSNNTELKRMMDHHLQMLSESFQKIYSNIKNNEKPKNISDGNSTIFMNLPEIIVDSYQFFYLKINELKKFFSSSKFYLFRGLNKFNKCLAIKEKFDNKISFAENLKSGKITIKTLLENLKI